MKKFLLLFISLFCFAKESTILTTTMHPFRLAEYAFYPSSTSIPKDRQWHYRLAISETNDYNKESRYFFDYEMTALTLQAQKALSSQSKLRILIPYYYVHGGFMDSFLNWFHRATNTLQTPHNQYGNNKVFWEFGSIKKDSSFSTLGNIQIQTQLFLQKRFFGWKQAVLLGLKLPTASKSSGIGKGKTDIMGGWALYKKDDRNSWLINLWIARIAPFHLTQNTTSRPLLYSLYLQWTKDFGNAQLLLGAKHISSGYHCACNDIDSSSNEIVLGWKRKIFGKETIVFLSENLAPFYTSPDITFGIDISF